MIVIRGRFHLTPLPGVHLLSLPPLSTIAAASSYHCAVSGGRVSLCGSRQSPCIGPVFRLWNPHSSAQQAGRHYGGTNTAVQVEEVGFRKGNAVFQQKRAVPDWKKKQNCFKDFDPEAERGRHRFEKRHTEENSSRSFGVNRRENGTLNEEKRERISERGSRHGGHADWERFEKGSRYGGGDFNKGERPELRSRRVGEKFGSGRNSRGLSSPRDDNEVRSWEGDSRPGRNSDSRSRVSSPRYAGRFRPSAGAFQNERGRYSSGRSPREMQEASESGSRVAPPRDTGRFRPSTGTFQNERGRNSGGRFSREMQQTRSLSPKYGAGRRESDAMNEDTTYRGSRKPYQGSARYSHDPKKFYGSGEARGSTNSRIGYERRPEIKRRDSFNYNSRGRTEREETGTTSRIWYDRRLEHKHGGSFNHNSKGRTEGKETGTNSRIRHESYPEIKDMDSFNHNSERRAEREETETGFGRLGKILSSNSFQSGRKECGPRFVDSLNKDSNHSKFERGETRLLPVDTHMDREKRENNRNRIILKRPFEEFVEVETDVRRGGQGDYVESNGEEPAKKRLDALIKELAGLYFRHVNKALKDKAKWIEGKEVKQIVEHLLGLEQFSHAYQVLKWAEKQYWFQADFELITKVCNACCRKGVISGARELFDMLKRSLFAPEASTYAALIGAYLKEGKEQSVKSAWELYHEMKQQGGYEPSSDVKFSLFCALTEKPQESLKWVEQADGLFETIKSSGVAPSTEMYASLIHLHALNSDAERVSNLLQGMKASGLVVSSDIFRVVLNMWTKVGDYREVEKFYEENIDVDEPDWYNYVLLIEAYMKGGLRSKALQVLDEMVLSVGTLKKEMYEALIHVMAKADERDYAENLLKELEETKCHSLQSAYNAVMDMYLRQHLFDEAEKLFERMETKGCRPDEDSYNILIMLHLERGQFEKAEEAYERMLRKETLNPNQKTYNLMLEAFGKAGQLAKVCQVYEQLSSNNYAVPFELRPYLKAAGRLKETITGPKLESRPRLEKSQREILAGVLLGGAQIVSSNGGLSNEIHFELSSVSSVGKTLFYHLHKEFVRWAKDPPASKPIEGPDDTSMENQVLHFSTLSHPTFRFFARQYRPKGKPTIPRMIPRWLSSRTLAYWYMYGGYKCSETGRMVLNASCYSVEELLPVVRTLKATLVRRDSGNVIRFYGSSEVSFWTVVKPFILPELVDVLQPNDHRLDCTDNDSWEEFEGTIIDETRYDASAAEPVDANEEVATTGNHQGLGPIKLSNLQSEAEVEAQTSIKAIGKNEEKKAVAKPSIWERFAEIVQTT